MNGGGAGDLLAPANGPALSRQLLDYARGQRWFRAKSKVVSGARLADRVPLGAGAALALLEIDYTDGGRDLYVIPLVSVEAARAQRVKAETPGAVVASAGGETLVDGLITGDAAMFLMETVRRGATVRGERGLLRGQASATFDDVAAGGALGMPRAQGAEQTNSTIIFGDRALMKIYRQLADGPNPEAELGLFLTARGQEVSAPRLLGTLTYAGHDGREHSVGVVHEFLANDGDAWSMTLRAVREFLAQTAALPPPDADTPAPLGRYAALAATLGRRTGQLHQALAAAGDDPAFAPEPLTTADRNALAAEVTAMLDRHAAALALRLPLLDARLRATAVALLSGEGRQRLNTVLDQFRRAPLDVIKTRTHGDLHLGQVLCRDDDFVIIDFEGEPSRPLEQRRAKGSPLRDVMGMVRSFDYAPGAVLRENLPAARAGAAAWARAWTRQVTDIYLGSYLDTVAGARFLPGDPEQLALMLAFYQLEKVVYEVGYELDNRPDWLAIPLAGLGRLAGLGEDT